MLKLAETLKLHYDVDGSDFTTAGQASGDVKTVLKKLGLDSDAIRRVAIAMYEGEINMVIHADGGTADIEISDTKISVILQDRGPGIPDIDLAMKEGFTTAPDEIRSLGFGAGMGLPNMKKYADEFNITTEIGVGTRVEMAVII